jgi:hypothetical protein
VLWQPTPAVTLKRSRPDVEPQPQPLPTRVIPTAVWEDHLLPRLWPLDAARLACTCKALRGVVREHFVGDLGSIDLPMKLQAALTSFPRARSLSPYENRKGKWGAAQTALVKWLHEGGRGRYITTMSTTPCQWDDDVNDVVHAALRGGALPSLKDVAAALEDKTQRAVIRDGLCETMHELRLRLNYTDDLEPQLAALGLVRQLPALTTLELNTDDDDDDPVQWPPFIPPSLKTLLLNDDYLPMSSLLRALPGILGGSGAGLERLEVQLGRQFESRGDELVHLPQALRVCSPTLKSFRLSPEDGAGDDNLGATPQREDEDYMEQMERLRMQWAGLLAGVSACRELEVLELLPVQAKPVFPPGTAFARLTELKITDHERGHPPEPGVMGLWEMMASGGLPGLAKLTVRLQGRLGAEEVKAQVSPAFEAVAGTLTCLLLDISPLGEWPGKEGVAYELGVAVGKLRRLKDLALNLSDHGRPYHAVAQGLAASGGDRPLPLLWRMKVIPHVAAESHLLASLLLPSVRVFISDHRDSSEALLLACAVRQTGYKYTWAPGAAAIQEYLTHITDCSITGIRALSAYELAIPQDI